MCIPLARRRSGFTLVELLVVIAVIAVLVMLLLPAVNAAREAARMNGCKNNIRQLGLALINHESAKRRLPSGWIAPADEPDGEPGWGWGTEVLPFLEENHLYNQQLQRRLAIDDPANEAGRMTVLSAFLCPSDPNEPLFMLHEGEGHEHSHTEDHDEHEHEEEEHEHEEGPALFQVARSNYVGMFGTTEVHDNPSQGNGVLFHNSRVRFRGISDGLSKTIFVGERSSKIDKSVWVGVIHGAEANMERVVGSTDHPPNAVEGHFDDFSSHHPTGAHFVMGDGSVLLLADTIDPVVYQALATRDGHEALTADFTDR